MMRNNKFTVMGVGVLASAALGTTAYAQSADALVDKLVEKGILTVKEAKDLREETDKDFTRAMSAKNGMPDWVTSLKFNGDFRGRFEKHNSENTLFSDRNRFRYRLRFGVTASLLDDFEVGFRLASANADTGNVGFGGNPVSANTDLGNGGSRKFVYMDAAYAKWNPIHSGDWNWSATFGKMDNPFQVSNMIFDYDYQPEGFALQGSYNFNDNHALKFIGGLFILDELNQVAAVGALTPSPSRDPYLVGGQLLLESKWTPKIESAFTLAAFGIGNKDNLQNAQAPNVNQGNTRDINTAPQYDFNPIVGGASVTYKLDTFPFYAEPFPVKLGGEYMYNPAAASQNRGYWVGVTLGKAGKKGLWEASYKYQRLEGDAWYEELPDDDNGAFYAGTPLNAGTPAPGFGYFGGTNIKGHVMKLTYNITDAMNLAVTYYLTELIRRPAPLAGAAISESGHVMLDLMWKF